MKKVLTGSAFILGGASSGKSSYAESIVLSTGCPRSYVATAQAWDDEMRGKIADHQHMRGPDWTTIEAPIDLIPALQTIPKGHATLVDCLTMWLTNLMLAEADIDAAVDALAHHIPTHSGPLVLVSNEIGQGVVPDNAMARRFVGIQGRANQRIAAACDHAVFVTAGIPHVLKGAP